MEKLQTARARKDRVEKLKVFFDEHGVGEYPDSVRPFKSSLTQSEFETGFSGSTLEDHVVKFRIPRGHTLRQALAVFQWEWSALQQ